MKFTQGLRHCVSESSVRNMKKAYFLKLRSVLDPAHINSFLMLLLAVRYQFNRSDTSEYIRPPSLAGGIVNRGNFN